MLRNFEKNWHWGKLTLGEWTDGSDGNPPGQRHTWNGWNLRIGWRQVALWHNYKPIINWINPWG